MTTLLRYRTVIYAGTLLTGLTGLTYQVVWQKYLSFIVGSESRSVSLVVAVFLGGLAAGYRFWGRSSERATSRRKLLRLYGCIELGIGIYAALFPLWLKAVTAIGNAVPAGLLTDLMLSLLTLLLPTFLMGATIPLLVSLVPDDAAEIHLCHAKIYGVNTLGACLGAFCASFFLIPRFGLQGSLLVASVVNVVVGTVFLLNPLRHEVTKEETVEPIPHNFPIQAVYFYTLITGTITLSLEVLFVRVLGLTIGAGPHNFAIVVGVFILGLAIGSLSLTGRLLSVRVLFRAITILSLYLMALFYTVPYWPYWLNNVRSAMRSLPVNYMVYMLLVTGFLALALLPFLIPMGMMLPLVYGLIPKTGKDYGKKCGWLYFYNTLGTAFGAIFLSYLSLYVLDLDQVFKVDVALLTLLALYLFYREKRWGLAAVVGVASVAFLAGPGWDRSSHYVGLFRSPEVEEFNFQGWFVKPKLTDKVVSFEDGPDTTVTISEASFPPYTMPGPDGRPVTFTSRSLVINGKADGDTIGDYSTNTLAALLPYLYAPDRNDLQVTVVGLGTGMTTGTLALAEDVAHVTAVEISSTLIDAMPEFAEANHGIATDPDVTLLGTDGFKYFNRLNTPQDIVVSATSPPWVVGVENLFTPEFYRLVHDALPEDGVFLQWFPLYTMGDVQFRTILSSLQQVFPHRRLYRISMGEMGILAAKAPVLDDLKARRFEEPAIKEICAGMQMDGLDQLMLIDLFEGEALDFVARSGETVTHTLTRPSLSYATDRIRFVTPAIDWRNFIDPRLVRLTHYSDARREAFESMLARYPFGQPCRFPTLGTQVFCTRYQAQWEAHLKFDQEVGTVSLRLQIDGYDTLRQEGVHPIDHEFLARAAAHIAERMPQEPGVMRPTLEALLGVYANDGLWDEAQRVLAEMAERELLPPDYHDRMMGLIAGRRQARDAFVNQYRGG